ncbi:MAG: FAD binding domain-containing protein [Rhodospirillales bacterium]|nr:FAD binding domain-containing protein [Rhodospirillales bacterium]
MSAIQRYLAPTTLEEALDALRESEATILAGGTDVMPQSQAGRLRLQPTLLNIRRIDELGGIALDGASIRIGALATISELLESELINERLPILAEAADHFASPQIRNAGTVGGNVCNASPAGDTLVPLIVLNAEVELASKRDGKVERRRMPLESFFAGPGRTHRAADELLTAIYVPAPAEGFVAHFAKFGTRPALDISAVSVGIGGVWRNGTFKNARVAFGAVAPTPVRGRATEGVLEGSALDAAAIGMAAAAARDEVRPISDVRASAWYRKEMIHSLTKKVLTNVADA